MNRNAMPVIGLTMDSGDRPGRYQLHGDYVTSLQKAGGLPWPIAYGLDQRLIPTIVDHLDGILFTGGDDLDPALYGQTRHEKAVPIDPVRQQFELALLAEVERRRLPTLGICLGCQLMNVYRGGTLHQFLPDVPRPQPIEHRRLDRKLPRHEVRLEADSAIARAIGRSTVLANTYHKQAPARPGRGLRITGRSPDGIIEAMEDPTLPMFVAVQWHPERLHDEPDHLALFQMLVREALRSRPEHHAQAEEDARVG